MRLAPAAMILVAIAVAGCSEGDAAARAETLRAMGVEMADEERAAMCGDDGHDAAYFSFASRWGSIFDMRPPGRGEFEVWLARDVCRGAP